MNTPAATDEHNSQDATTLKEGNDIMLTASVEKKKVNERYVTEIKCYIVSCKFLRCNLMVANTFIFHNLFAVFSSIFTIFEFHPACVVNERSVKDI